MAKRKFTYAERYAVWHCHGRRCWLCKVPLRLVEVTIDHVLPESLLTDDARRGVVLAEYGLTDTFLINSYSNWLPSHTRCNQAKGSVAGFIPGNAFLLQGLVKRAPEVERAAHDVISNAGKDEVFSTLFAALERQTITATDLQQLLASLLEAPAPTPRPEEVILLDNGYWVNRRDLAREGYCVCDRPTCVDSSNKIYSYFRSDLSPWVIRAGLYWKCYDELVECRRCGGRHKRGHTGKLGVCSRPFQNQESQTD